MVNKADCVELGLTCADICQTLSRGTSGSQADQPSQAALEMINQLTT